MCVMSISETGDIYRKGSKHLLVSLTFEVKMRTGLLRALLVSYRCKKMWWWGGGGDERNVTGVLKIAFRNKNCNLT